MKVMLLNDTASVPHIGCQAVSDAHARLLGAAGHIVSRRFFLGELKRFAMPDEEAAIQAVLRDEPLRDEIEACDAVVVNGEGTLHHGAGTEYFAMLGAAQRLGRATLIVNAVFEAHKGWQQVLSRLDDFCVRDAASLECARQLGLRCRLQPDSILGAQFDEPKFIDLREQIVVTDWHPVRDHDVGATLRTILGAVEGSVYFPMLHGIHAHLWRGALAAWSEAGCIITARHHGVYLAVAAGRPFVALPSNTRKIEGLFQAAGVTIPICTTTGEVEAALGYAYEHLVEYERLTSYLRSFLPLQTFSALGRGTDETTPQAEADRLRDQLRGKSRSDAPSYWGLGNGAAAGLRSLG